MSKKNLLSFFFLPSFFFFSFALYAPMCVIRLKYPLYPTFHSSIKVAVTKNEWYPGTSQEENSLISSVWLYLGEFSSSCISKGSEWKQDPVFTLLGCCAAFWDLRSVSYLGGVTKAVNLTQFQSKALLQAKQKRINKAPNLKQSAWLHLWDWRPMT